MSAKPAPVAMTRVKCANCDTLAPSVVVSERRRLVAHLQLNGWHLTLGEAVCGVCRKTEEALSGRAVA